MPAVAYGKVLLTGINSFTGMAIAKGLLELGYAVRGTVRSEAKATHPRDLFKPYGDKIEVVVATDLTMVRRHIVPCGTSLVTSNSNVGGGLRFYCQRR